MNSAPPHLTQELTDALGQHHITSRRIELISPLKERKGSRFAYRVDTADGQIFKLRHFESAAEASRLRHLRADLDAAFAPVLAQYGAVLVEAWIDGTPLCELDADCYVEPAAVLLGRLHQQPLNPAVFSEVSQYVDTEKFLSAAQSDLALLGAARALTATEVASLLAILQRDDPRRARNALIHKDFCAENMLIDRHGALRVIDNELLTIEPAGLDLGRTFHRWPMSEAAWQRFLRGYVQVAALPDALEFWKIAAALISSRVCLQRAPHRLDASLMLLRRMIESPGSRAL